MENKKGFTLIELVVAVAILGVLTLISIPAVKNIQSSNKNTKYIAYEKAMKTAAKTYVDSFSEDLFGDVNTGCAVVQYGDLTDKELIEAIQVKGVSCAGNGREDTGGTYVYVMKARNGNYSYFSNIVCKEGSETVYSNRELTRGSCGVEDQKAPTVTVINENPITSNQQAIDHPYNNGAADDTAKYPKIKVIVEDKNSESGEQAIGIRPGDAYTKLYYQWYKNGSKVTSTGGSGTVPLKIQGYYNGGVSAYITNPKTDMDLVEADSVYKVKVYGKVTDMDNNSQAFSESQDGWQPNDYQSASHGYEFEKKKKCPTYSWTQSNGTAATTTGWYNNNRHGVSVTINRATSQITKFNPYTYVVENSVNDGTTTTVDSSKLASPNPVYSIPNTVNGTSKYKVSYYKQNGTIKYTCGFSDKYHFDHINPSITYSLTGTTGNSGSIDSTHKNHSGYKGTATSTITCTKNDDLSPVTTYFAGTARTNPFTYNETSHGSHSYDAECKDAAGNSASGSKSFFVIVHTNGNESLCGCDTWSLCRHKNHGTETYSCNCRNVCQGGYKEDCIRGIYHNATQCKRDNGSAWYFTNGNCCRQVYDNCKSTKRVCDTCTRYKEKRTSNCSCQTAKACWY